jgi:hypothetical protein
MPGFVSILAGLLVISGLLVFGLPDLFFVVMALGLIGLVFKVISLIRRGRNPYKFNGNRSKSEHLITDLIVVAGVVLVVLLLIFFLTVILGSLI